MDSGNTETCTGLAAPSKSGPPDLAPTAPTVSRSLTTSPGASAPSCTPGEDARRPGVLHRPGRRRRTSQAHDVLHEKPLDKARGAIDRHRRTKEPDALDRDRLPEHEEEPRSSRTARNRCFSHSPSEATSHGPVLTGFASPPPPGMWTRGERLFPAVLKRGKEVTAAWFQAQGGAWLHYTPGDVWGGVRL